jgi:hypothetical protein
MRDTELNQLLENWDGRKPTIRPSAVDGFAQCSRQWAMTHIGGISSMPGARAAIGTAIHAAVEQEWKQAIITGKKDFNISAMQDLAAAELASMDQETELNYDFGEDVNTATGEAAKGVAAFAEDIAPFTPIPIAVETRFTVELDHPIFENLSGTVDYISKDTIADVKTSKRKPVPQSYVTQQSIYKYLAEANGHNVKHSMIQGVVLKTKTEGHIMELEPDIDRAKLLVNTMLDVGEVFSRQIIHPDVLFRGNPKYYLCSDKYCALHRTCPYVKGALSPDKPKVKL